jgi:hypothetical protein
MSRQGIIEINREIITDRQTFMIGRRRSACVNAVESSESIESKIQTIGLCLNVLLCLCIIFCIIVASSLIILYHMLNAHIINN